jgi:chemotaxis signal transduction protein
MTPSLSPLKPASNASSSATPKSANLIKLISFQLQSPQDSSRFLTFAVAIGQVQRILNQAVVLSSGINPVGLVADQEITIIDLHQLIFGAPLTESGYLVVLRSQTQGLFGIPIVKSPTLAELDPANLKPLPASYREMDTLGIASHVGKAESDEGQQTVFILDLDRLVGHLSRKSVGQE